MKGKEGKPHIGIFGRRNVGKSSLINCLAGQDVAIVSPEAGTTTDPVKKSMEIFGIGPAVLIDTAGTDDRGELGKKRVEKTLEVIRTIDLAILVIEGNRLDDPEEALILQLGRWEVPFIILHNKSDLEPLKDEFSQQVSERYGRHPTEFSTFSPSRQDELIGQIRAAMPETAFRTRSMVGDIISKGDLVLLITPIDSEAPEGRMILPQVQVIRDILDHDAIAMVTKETDLEVLLEKIQPRPSLAITDSQAFRMADTAIPGDIPLTSFSTLLAWYKGDFENYLRGTSHLSRLKEGDRVLILESCTHEVSCDDIGRVKIPKWLSAFTGKRLNFQVVSGLDPLPGRITDYSMVIQCGGCMVTRRQLINRLKPAVEAGIPVTNYGMAIAYMHGIFERAVAPFVKTDHDVLSYL